MKKGLLINEKMGSYEKEQGCASYKTLTDYFIGDMVLCNNIVDIDISIWDNISLSPMTEYSENYPEFYQFYLCNLNDWAKREAVEHGLILSYSNKLDCDVLCVDHYGTSWDYVLTDVKLFDDWEELEKYENENK